VSDKVTLDLQVGSSASTRMDNQLPIWTFWHWLEHLEYCDRDPIIIEITKGKPQSTKE